MNTMKYAEGIMKKRGGGRHRKAVALAFHHSAFILLPPGMGAELLD